MKEENKLKKQLLVEGKDDLHVVYAFCEQYKLPQNFEVIDCKGIPKLKDLVPRIFKQTQDLDTIGVIVDADTNLQSIWDFLKDSFTKQGFVFPKNIPLNGLILSNSDDKKIGIWIMPNNDLTGTLEDFVKLLIPNNDNLKQVVEDTLIDIENKKLNKYAQKDRQKAFINTWLAWQEKSGIQMGQAITSKILSTNNQNAQNFSNWLINLFK